MLGGRGTVSDRVFLVTDAREHGKDPSVDRGWDFRFLGGLESESGAVTVERCGLCLTEPSVNADVSPFT